MGIVELIMVLFLVAGGGALIIGGVYLLRSLKLLGTGGRKGMVEQSLEAQFRALQLAEEMLAAQKETNTLLRQLLARQGGEQGER